MEHFLILRKNKKTLLAESFCFLVLIVQLEYMVTLNIFTMALRLILAMFLGGILGIERTMSGKMAGLRTYALVSTGSALFVIISQTLAEQMTLIANFDPSRIASQVLVGVGFIGAGLVIFKDSKLTGLTTAAGLWLVAGIGMACGFGLYKLAIISTLIGLFILVMWFIEKPLQDKNNDSEVNKS